MSLEKRVMIVEDSNTVRYEVKLLLKKIGVVLIEVANSIGMYNAIEEYGKVVDLIIMDLTLKNENGFDLIKSLKASERYNNIPVLILTEHADRDNVLTAKDIGVEGYLRKPINGTELLERVSKILGI